MHLVLSKIAPRCFEIIFYHDYIFFRQSFDKLRTNGQLSIRVFGNTESIHHSLLTIRHSRYYSVRNDDAGLESAALIAWYETVSKAIPTAKRPATTKTHHCT